jgi:metal-responsive CopG/Arc/MetJ family transcriptional regulator
MTISMKVAVSIPDSIFIEADALAARLKTSRSDIYAKALSVFIGTHDPARVTDLMNKAIEAADAEADDCRMRAAQRVFERSQW